MKNLERENMRLKKLGADQSIDNSYPKKTAWKNVQRRRGFVGHVRAELSVSQRYACLEISQIGNTKSRRPRTQSVEVSDGCWSGRCIACGSAKASKLQENCQNADDCGSTTDLVSGLGPATAPNESVLTCTTNESFRASLTRQHVAAGVSNNQNFETVPGSIDAGGSVQCWRFHVATQQKIFRRKHGTAPLFEVFYDQIFRWQKLSPRVEN